jgi:ATP-dependent DNA ligase
MTVLFLRRVRYDYIVTAREWCYAHLRLADPREGPRWHHQETPAERSIGTAAFHEIKHDGFRLMARRDPVGIRLITRGGHDWSARYPLVVEAVNHLFKVRSCLLDGEMVCCDEKGVTSFQLFRHRRNEPQAFLYAFDLLELNGTDLRAGADRRRRWPASCARTVPACA